MARNPNAGGSGPKVTKQGKAGPITGTNSSKTGTNRPWGLTQGTNGSSKSKFPPAKVGKSPSKERGGWKY
jgi:hypothetical protein